MPVGRARALFSALCLTCLGRLTANQVVLVDGRPAEYGLRALRGGDEAQKQKVKLNADSLKPSLLVKNGKVVVYGSYDIKDKLRALGFRFSVAEGAWTRPLDKVLALSPDFEAAANVTIEKLLASRPDERTRPLSATLTPLTRVYMHVARASFDTLFQSFFATATDSLHTVPWEESGKDNAEPRGKHPRQSANRPLRWVLCFVDLDSVHTCPALKVLLLEGDLELQWHAAPGGTFWREIRNSTSGQSDASTAIEAAYSCSWRAYGPFGSKEPLSKVARQLQRLFLLRCNDCSRSEARGLGVPGHIEWGMLHWHTRTQHRMAAVLADAVFREAAERSCSTRAAPAAPGLPALPSHSQSPDSLLQGPTSLARAGSQESLEQQAHHSPSCIHAALRTALSRYALHYGVDSFKQDSGSSGERLGDPCERIQKLLVTDRPPAVSKDGSNDMVGALTGSYHVGGCSGSLAASMKNVSITNSGQLAQPGMWVDAADEAANAAANVLAALGDGLHQASLVNMHSATTDASRADIVRYIICRPCTNMICLCLHMPVYVFQCVLMCVSFCMDTCMQDVRV